MSSQIVASIAAVALLGTGLANAGDIRASQAIPAAASMMGAGDSGGSSDEKCRVDVSRTGADGSADITRQVLDNGKCVCIVTTGQEASNGAAEDTVKALRKDRTCAAAPLVAGASPGVAPAAAAAGAAGGGSGVLLPVLLGGVAAAGLAVGMGKSSKG